MKKPVNLLFFAIIFLYGCNTIDDSQLETKGMFITNKPIPVSWFKSADYGVVTLTQGLDVARTMLTKQAFAELMEENTYINAGYIETNGMDSIGKYYAIPQSNRILLGLSIGSIMWFTETDKNGKVYNVEPFNIHDFTIYKDHFVVESSCGNGPGYYASQLFFFKDLVPQDSLKGVFYSCYDQMAGIKKVLVSTYSIDGNKIIMNYQTETGSYVYKNDDDEDPQYIAEDKHRFEIVYQFKNNCWTPTDTAKYKLIEPFMCY